MLFVVTVTTVILVVVLETVSVTGSDSCSLLTVIHDCFFPIFISVCVLVQDFDNLPAMTTCTFLEIEKVRPIFQADTSLIKKKTRNLIQKIIVLGLVIK